MALWLSGAEAYRQTAGQSFCAALFHDSYPTWWNLFSLLYSHFILSWMLHNRMWILKVMKELKLSTKDKRHPQTNKANQNFFSFFISIKSFFILQVRTEETKSHSTHSIYFHISANRNLGISHSHVLYLCCIARGYLSTGAQGPASTRAQRAVNRGYLLIAASHGRASKT